MSVDKSTFSPPANLKKLKESIQYRPRFKVNNIEQLKDKWIIAPEHGEEHWVGALYTMFSHLVTVNSPCQKLWVRPRTFCGTGLDSIAVPLEENSLKEIGAESRIKK